MVYGVMGISIPTVLLAQSVQGPTTQETNTLSEASGADTINGTQMAYGDIPQDSERYSNAEIDHRFNEVRRELLDDRASTIEWWLAAVGVFLALLAILGLFGFREFRELKKEARAATEIAEESANKARDLVEEIEQIRDKSHEYYQGMTAKKAGDDPAAEEKAEAVSKDPQASLKDKLIASAIALQKEGKTDEAIKRWRSIASATEGIDNDLAADAWFSIGYLEAEKGGDANLEKGILAYDRAIDLASDHVEYHHNRGATLVSLGRIAEARAAFEKARDIAKNAGDEEMVSMVEKNLQELEDSENT